MKKRLVSAVVCTAMAATMLAGCGSKGGTTEKATEKQDTTADKASSS